MIYPKLQFFNLMPVVFIANMLPFAASMANDAASNPINATVLMRATTSWDGQPIVYPSGSPEITSVMVEMPPNAETGWHQHRVTPVGMILEGELEVQLRNGLVKRIKAGDVLVEVANTWHNGRNAGSTPVKIIVFYLGAVGQNLTIP